MSEAHLPRAAMFLALVFSSPAFANDPTSSPETRAQQPAPEQAQSAPSSDSAETSASESPTPSPSNAQADARAADAAQAGDDEIVCKKVEVTGTRLRKGKVCKSQREWRELANAAREVMKRNDRKRSTQPGGETLIGGG